MPEQPNFAQGPGFHRRVARQAMAHYMHAERCESLVLVEGILLDNLRKDFVSYLPVLNSGF